MELITNEKAIKSISEEKGIFSYVGISIIDKKLITLKGCIKGKEINIAINTSHKKNYINITLANQLLIQEPSIGERKYIFGQKEYENNDLQVEIDHYECISQFTVITMVKKYIDIIISLPWFI